MSRSGVLDRIDVLLATVSDPAFTAIYRGEPLALGGTPVLAFWMVGRTVDFLTLSDVSTTANFLIRAYFRVQTSADVRENLELDVWDAMVNIDTALRSDSDLDGNCTDTNIGTASAGYVELGGVAYRTVEIPYEVEIYGEVSITP